MKREKRKQAGVVVWNWGVVDSTRQREVSGDDKAELIY
jgi:hypothetical protein